MSPRDLFSHCTVLRFPRCLRMFGHTRVATPFGGMVSLSCMFFWSQVPVSRVSSIRRQRVEFPRVVSVVTENHLASARSQRRSSRNRAEHLSVYACKYGVNELLVAGFPRQVPPR